MARLDAVYMFGSRYRPTSPDKLGTKEVLRNLNALFLEGIVTSIVRTLYVDSRSNVQLT